MNIIIIFINVSNEKGNFVLEKNMLSINHKHKIKYNRRLCLFISYAFFLPLEHLSSFGFAGTTYKRTNTNYSFFLQITNTTQEND